jgi:toxin FitB
VAEIRLDIERVAEPGRRTKGKDRRMLSVRPMFERRVLPVSEGNMRERRLLIEDGGKIGHALLQPDRMIGATALEHGLTVVSRDTSDYERARAPVLNSRPAAAGL